MTLVAEALPVHQPSDTQARIAPFQLNAHLDRAALNRLLREHGRVQIPSILDENSAQTLFETLSKETAWGLMLGAGHGIGRRYASPEQYSGFNSLQRQALYDMAHAFTGQRGAHLHEVRPIALDEYERTTDPSPLARFADFLNTERFIGFARELTGAQDVGYVTAQATCFRPGHFFGFHTDAEDDDQQRATCVFYFTPHWRREWGGLLHFKDEHNQLVDVFSPRFNSLSVFGYSEDHAVSVVGPDCPFPRFAVAAALMAK